MPETCPRCGGVFTRPARLCGACGATLDAEGTLEMLPGAPSEDALVLLRARPIEFPRTVHRIHRRPLQCVLSLLRGPRRRRERAQRERTAARLSRQLRRQG